MITYSEISAAKLLKQFSDQGYVELSLNMKQAQACRRVLTLLDLVYGPEFRTLPWAKKTAVILSSIKLSLYILTRYSALSELVALYTRGRVGWECTEQGDDFYVVTLRKSAI